MLATETRVAAVPDHQEQHEEQHQGTPPDAETALASLQKHGKSFAWAAQFLGREHAEAGARLYAICRAIDDMADDNPPARARELLTALRNALNGLPTSEPLAQNTAAHIHTLAQMIPLNQTALLHLIDGVEQDLEPVRLADEPALIRYAYRVAGTVGLMMCNVLGVTDHTAHRHAIDLGIAMQLTNIARDVLEDAQQDRRYLPGHWVALDPGDIATPNPAQQAQTEEAIARLLVLAETYYASGQAGLVYLPARARVAIAIAARVYRAIGRSLAARGCDYQRGRVVIPTWRKALISLGVVLSPRLYRRKAPTHDPALHASLGGITQLAGPHHGQD
ncbi:MAG: phytoene/squalene synthase family protein [Pseudomonadota bacterium]